MQSKGIIITKEMLQTEHSNDEVRSIRQIHFNKVSLYQEWIRDTSNATLLVEFNGIKIMAILDTRDGISVATKSYVKDGVKKCLEKLAWITISRQKLGTYIGTIGTCHS